MQLLRQRRPRRPLAPRRERRRRRQWSPQTAVRGLRTAEAAGATAAAAAGRRRRAINEFCRRRFENGLSRERPLKNRKRPFRKRPAIRPDHGRSEFHSEVRTRFAIPNRFDQQTGQKTCLTRSVQLDRRGPAPVRATSRAGPASGRPRLPFLPFGCLRSSGGPRALPDSVTAAINGAAPHACAPEGAARAVARSAGRPAGRPRRNRPQ